ncbi:hypothetical protein HYX14_06535 [Candidatus Woesearchaeota archaeon]|nr:hypothetical protein [Candidatus Woesearchaeota archaeon]
MLKFLRKRHSEVSSAPVLTEKATGLTGKAPGLTGQELLKEAYTTLVKRRSPRKVSLLYEDKLFKYTQQKESFSRVISVDSDVCHDRYGYMSYDSAHFFQFWDTQWILALGKHTGSYPGEEYQADIIAARANFEPEESDLAEKVMKVLELANFGGGRKFKCSLAVAMEGTLGDYAKLTGKEVLEEMERGLRKRYQFEEVSFTGEFPRAFIETEYDRSTILYTAAHIIRQENRLLVLSQGTCGDAPRFRDLVLIPIEGQVEPALVQQKVAEAVQNPYAVSCVVATQGGDLAFPPHSARALDEAVRWEIEFSRKAPEKSTKENHPLLGPYQKPPYGTVVRFDDDVVPVLLEGIEKVIRSVPTIVTV